ncbi:hypothetical protein TNCV_2662481 [Trichonephila clavipes]|nr:hypothetical protein TNCV_2662481 [Trichonephila clavipes]
MDPTKLSKNKKLLTGIGEAQVTTIGSFEHEFKIDDENYSLRAVGKATRETCEHSMAEAVREAVDENDGKGTLLLLLMVAGRSVVFFEEWLGDSHKC